MGLGLIKYIWCFPAGKKIGAWESELEGKISGIFSLTDDALRFHWSLRMDTSYLHQSLLLF